MGIGKELLPRRRSRVPRIAPVLGDRVRCSVRVSMIVLQAKPAVGAREHPGPGPIRPDVERNPNLRRRAAAHVHRELGTAERALGRRFFGHPTGERPAAERLDLGPEGVPRRHGRDRRRRWNGTATECKGPGQRYGQGEAPGHASHFGRGSARYFRTSPRSSTSFPSPGSIDPRVATLRPRAVSASATPRPRRT